MSDIASPILAVMDNEAHAFICFCGIMKRLEGNFRPDGQLMSVKFQHLKLLLQYSDPDFYSYLVSRGADDLFFCYRWLLLDLKREFAFDDALRMLEVTWSSLPPDPPETEVELLGPPQAPVETTSCNKLEKRIVNGFGDDKDPREKQRVQHMLRPPREDPGRNHVAERSHLEQVAKAQENHRGVRVSSTRNQDLPNSPFERQTSFGEFKYYTARNEDSFEMNDGEQPRSPAASESRGVVPRRQSTAESEDDAGERTPLITDCENGPSPVSTPPLFLSGLSAWKSGPSVSPGSLASPSHTSPKSAAQGGGDPLARTVPVALTSSTQVLCSPGISMTPLPAANQSADSPPHSQTQSQLSSPVLALGKGPLPSGIPAPPRAETSTSSSTTTSVKPCSLPPPQEFGKGNPFMLFLCLSILLEHRDHIIKNGLDYNELAMHFDRLVRRHQLSRVLQRAKALFADYLQSEVWDSEEGDEVSLDSPPPPTAGAAAHQHSACARPVRSPLASPRSALSSPRSTYNLASTIPSPPAAAVAAVSPAP